MPPDQGGSPVAPLSPTWQTHSTATQGLGSGYPLQGEVSYPPHPVLAVASSLEETPAARMRLSLQTWMPCDIQGISVFLKYINVAGASVRIGNPDHPSFPGPPCAGLKCPSHSPANSQCDPQISESGRAPRSGLESGCLPSSLPLLPSLNFFKKKMFWLLFFFFFLGCLAM